jgi:hypothetical protein
MTISFFMKNIDNRVHVVTTDNEDIGTLEIENGLLWFIRNAQFSSDDPVVYGFVRAFCGEAGRVDLAKFFNCGLKYEPQEAW